VPISEFKIRVQTVVANIPKGSVLSYKAVAEQAGNAQAARAVANIMAANYDPLIPCHRVIRTDGGLGGYNRGGTSAKAAILAAEGVVL
jgi:O-6-methylguanine DNA methyltransferase